MRAIALFLLAATSALPMFSSDSIGVYTYTADPRPSVSIDTIIQVYPVFDNHVGAEDILAIPDSAFLDSATWSNDHRPRYVWVRFALRNNGLTPVSDYVFFNGNFDTVEVYRREDDTLLFRALTGRYINPTEKQVPHLMNPVEVVVASNSTTTIYARVVLDDRFDKGFFFRYYVIWSDSHAVQHYTKMFTVQAFYSGIMMLFCLVSAFMYISFKERTFIYFAFLMLCLNLYFLISAGISRTFLWFGQTSIHLPESNLMVAGVTFFGYFFVSSYLTVKRSNPKLNRVFFFLSMYVMLVCIAQAFGLSDLVGTNIMLNLHITIWMVFLVYLIVVRVLKRDKHAIVMAISIALLLTGATGYTLSLMQVVNIGELGRDGFQIGTILFSGTLFYGLFESIADIQRERIAFQVEKEQADAILFNILPAEVAEELKSTGISKAKNFDNATVLFTDFVDFTSISGGLSADELVIEINTCFKAFDDILQLHHIEKIKTIGDAYMAAGGIQGSEAGTPIHCILAALEMQLFITQRKAQRQALGLPAFEMRVGLHTGPVVAGVIGVKKLQYDIWGDTVNTASRMESNGEAGHVNISQTTYDIIKDEAGFLFESRGEINVKGKGLIHMWFVSPAS